MLTSCSSFSSSLLASSLSLSSSSLTSSSLTEKNLGLAAIAAGFAAGRSEALEVATQLAWGAAAASLLIAVAAERPELWLPMVLTPGATLLGSRGGDPEDLGGVVGACKRTAAARQSSDISVLHQLSSSSRSASAASRALFPAMANDRRAKCCLQ